MTNIFSLSYLLNPKPGALHFSGIIFFLVFILAFIAIMFLFNIVRKRKNNIYFKIWRSLNSFAITNLIIGLFLLFFMYEEVRYLSMRMLAVLWLVAMVAWLVFIFRKFKEIPRAKEEFAKRKEYEKYLPK